MEKPTGEVITLTVGEDTIYLKKPTRAVVGLVLTKGAANPMAQAEVIIENCHCGGSLKKEVILADTGLLLGINAKMQEILGVKTVEVKNS